MPILETEMDLQTVLMKFSLFFKLLLIYCPDKKPKFSDLHCYHILKDG